MIGQKERKKKRGNEKKKKKREWVWKRRDDGKGRKGWK